MAKFKWVQADELQPGDVITTANHGVIEITSVVTTGTRTALRGKNLVSGLEAEWTTDYEGNWKVTRED